nr:MAG TPA: hypothetical protein [Myoviridae sp. ctNPX13]
MNQAVVNSSLAHTVGNVTFQMTEFIKSIFTPNFFRHTHISSRMAYREFKINENRQEAAFIKKNRPILIIRPHLEINDDIFMSGSMFTRLYNGATNYSKDYGQFLPLFRDDVNDISLSYFMNRVRVVLQVTMMFDTAYQQINVFNSIHNRFNENQIYWVHTALECFVPGQIVEQMSTLAKVPIRNEEMTVRPFLEYLTGHSNKYWTYKEKTASSREEFFVYYPVNMEYVLTDLSMDDLAKHGSVSESANINFTLSTEFNTIGAYQLSTERDDVMFKANMGMEISTTDGIGINTYYTPSKLFKEEDENGYKLFFTNMFQIEEGLPPKEPDVLDLSKLLGSSVLDEILEYHHKHGISTDMLFNFIILKNETILKGKKEKPGDKIDYVVDLEHKRVLIYNKNEDATYRILIYVNNLYIHQISDAISDYQSFYEYDYKER